MLVFCESVPGELLANSLPQKGKARVSGLSAPYFDAERGGADYPVVQNVSLIPGLWPKPLLAQMIRTSEGYRAIPAMATDGRCCKNRVLHLGKASLDDILDWCGKCGCFYRKGQAATVDWFKPEVSSPKFNTYGQVIE